MKVYIIWLIGVILWNFAVPNAAPIVYHSASWLYSFFAKYRFARLPHCQAVLKKTKKDEGLNK